MLELRRSNERGYADHQWLKSNHTFSFAEYYDPRHMGFRSLRLINEDRIVGGSGFGSHPHRDMEIISYVVKGALEHKDSMGTKAIIRPGEVQRMSAGAGVVHSEYNHQKDDETHFFQIWIQPKTRGGNPGYGQKSFEADLNSKNLVLVVSQDGRNGSIDIKQDADMYISRLKANEDLEFKIREGRGVWVQMVDGQVTVSGRSTEAVQDLASQTLERGDGAACTGEEILKFRAHRDSEFLIFDLP